MSEIREVSVAATVHGRYLLRRGDGRGVIVGFHGYAESAPIHLAALDAIPGIEGWTVAAVQALHPFYKGRTPEIVASWMTSLDRERTIADNIAYVRSVLSDLLPSPRLVFAGFSQGAAMAYRAAARIGGAAGLIVLGGHVPPDVSGDPAVILPPVLVGRGDQDAWYSAEKFDEDMRFLEKATAVSFCLYQGDHEWTDEFRAAAGAFLEKVRRQQVESRSEVSRES